MKKLRLAIYLLRYFGLSWLLFRIKYAFQQRTGWFKFATPAGKWEEFPLESLLIRLKGKTSVEELKNNRPQFFFDPAQQPLYRAKLLAYDQATLVENHPQLIADKLKGGEILYFSHIWQSVGSPPKWHQNPFTGQVTPKLIHWSQISDFGQGDIKNIWEPSRFSFTYGLVRAYWRTEDESIPELFWQTVLDWRKNNPPNMGANWKCGQETTFRVMAWCFGLYGFLNSPQTTQSRVAELVQMIAISGRRIEKNLDYALSQQNNHGVSEAVGLWLIGYLFPELDGASQWKALGRKHLEAQAQTLLYSDGAFAQQSFNYQRVMLHDYLWVVTLGRIAGEPFSKALEKRLKASANLLYQLQEGKSGELPNYGQNDGAYILPLNNCNYRDYRPLIQTLSICLENRKIYSSGPWDEDALWLLGLDAVSIEESTPLISKESFFAQESGYIALRQPESMAFIRCGSYQHRPAQADMMHLDLWWKGINIAIDPGTYSYNDPLPWNNPLAESKYHNVMTQKQQNHMQRYGRFLWFPWRSGYQDSFEESKDQVLWAGNLNYSRNSKWQRQVRGLAESTWIITDTISHDDQAEEYSLHWVLDDFSYKISGPSELTLTTSEGDYSIGIISDTEFDFSIQRAEPNEARGWQAKYYHYKQPSLSIRCTIKTHQGNLPKITTLFTPKNSIYELCNIDTI